MEAVSLSPSLTASSFGTSAAEKRGSATIACLSYAPSNNLNVRHLAAFHKQSHLFTKSPIRPFPSTKSRVRKSGNGNGIFLPHLVASLVCFLIFSFSCCNWNANFFFQCLKFMCSYVSCFFVFGSGTSWTNLHYGQTWWCSTCPCKLCSNFAEILSSISPPFFSLKLFAIYSFMCRHFQLPKKGIVCYKIFGIFNSDFFISL